MKIDWCRRYGMILLGLSLSCLPVQGLASEVELDLSEAVQTSLLSNLGLRLKQQDVAEAKGAAQSAEGTFAPLLSADIGASGQKTTPATISTPAEERTTSWQVGVQKRLITGTEVDLSLNNNTLDTDGDYLLFDPVYRTGVTLGVTQPLLEGRGSDTQTAELKAAKNVLEMRTYLVDDEAASLAAQVKNAYWELVFAHQNLEVLHLSLTLARQLRDETAARIETGKLAAIDRFQPESEVAVREQEIIAGERAIGTAEDHLKLLMNSDDWQTSLRPVDQPRTEPITADLNEIMEKALTGRADIKAATLQIRASEWQVKKAENRLLPALDLRGSVGFGGTAETYGNAIDNSFKDSDRQWQIGLRFSRPLDNSLAEGQYRQVSAQLAKNRTSLELLKQETRRLARTAVRDVELALKTIEAAGKTTFARRKSLEAEQTKFEAGHSTTLDVLIAQQDYARALSAEKRAKIVYEQILADLDRLQGIISLNH